MDKEAHIGVENREGELNREGIDKARNKERYALLGIVVVLLVLVGIVVYPSLNMGMGETRITGNTVLESKSAKTPGEYYTMFKCPCCGQPIDSNCCGMAKERKDYLDTLLLEELEENEVVHRMAKKFGFSVLQEPSKENEVKEYLKNRAPDNPPKIDINNPRYNFGTISQKDGNVSTKFTIKNNGESDLIIDNLDSSCMCTSASITYNGIEGPKFGMGMHGGNPKDYQLSIPAGESAQLNVYYDPWAHGKQNEKEQRIIREIAISSNDPVDFQKKVRIELTQVP